MDIFAQAAEKIIREQEKIIGPIALEQAGKVAGMTVDWGKHEVVIVGDEKKALEELVRKYQMLFGKASIEVCKEAIQPLSDKLTTSELPDILK